MHVDELRHELGRLADEMQVPTTAALERVRQERRRRQRRTWSYATLCLVVVVLGGVAVAVANRGEPDRVVTGLANDPPPSVTVPLTSAAGPPIHSALLAPKLVMPSLIGESFNALFDSNSNRVTPLAEADPLTFHWVANDSVASGVVFAQFPQAGQPSTGRVDLWISVGGPIVSLDSLSAADRDVARRIGIVDDREPIQKIETSAGPAYKVDAFLFAADCKAVTQAYRTSIDPSYGDVCTSEPGRMLGM